MKLTKKELRNLYHVYSNGELLKEIETTCVNVSATLFDTDKDMFHKTMSKISKMYKRNK